MATIVVAQSPDLIPRKLIFGNPSRLAPKLSPDGKSFAWIAPRDGVLNVWVAPVDALASAKPVTEASGVNYLKKEWVPVAASVTDDIAFLTPEAKGEWNVLSQTHDNRKRTLQVDRVREPVKFYLYDREAKQLTRLFSARPDLEGRALAPRATRLPAAPTTCRASRRRRPAGREMRPAGPSGLRRPPPS